jgi:CubicO group peptidase (beta-lactamase class C family)
MNSRIAASCLKVMLLSIVSLTVDAADEPVYPGATWAKKKPSEVGLSAEKLKAFSNFVGGRGCVVRHGYLVYSWGDVSRRADIASAAKPFYAHFLWKAIEDGKIESVDEKAVKWEPRLRDINKAIGFKDREIRWRDFANQTSCYQLAERPGTAFDYNDWQMALFWDILFLKVYGATYDNVDEKVFHPLLTDVIQCQDNPTMMAFGTRNRPGRVAVSVRDFARFGLLYLREGKWNGKQLISRKHAGTAVSSPLPNSIPRAGNKAAEMIAGQRTMGSGRKPDNQTDHFGSYSWLWWTNGVDRHGTRMFPDAPHDLYGAFGHGGPRAMWVIPSLDIVVSYNDAKMKKWTSGKENPTNEAMKRLIGAVEATETSSHKSTPRSTNVRLVFGETMLRTSPPVFGPESD